MKRCLWIFLTLAWLVGCQNNQPKTEAQTDTMPAKKAITLKEGTWRAIMKSPGGDLPFRLEITTKDGHYQATAHNGSEVLPFDVLTLQPDGSFRLAIEHYDSTFEGKSNPEGTQLTGTWRKTVDHTRVATLAFEAFYGQTERFPITAAAPAEIAPLWDVVFSPNGDEPGIAVAEFQQDGTKLTGTFMTPTGDYRFLEGVVNGSEIALSCFDGGHAFLFKAKLDAEGGLTGDFWSSDKWHETWTAKINPEATLPDAMTLTESVESQNRFRFNFPDLEGTMISQDDPRFAGKAMIVSIFGSWCPNCNDEAPFLQELHQTYADRGLEVMGLAFEATGDAVRDTRMLKRFKKRHGLDYLILLAGQRDKSAAGATLPDINHVLAYPTTLFINQDGQVVDIHTGFTGPGTGARYTNLKKKYHQLIENLLEKGN